MPPGRRPRRLDRLNRTSLAFHLGRNDIVMAGPELAVGEQLELSIGAVAHGGHCVARAETIPTAGSCSCGTPCPASGCAPWSPRTRPSFCRADAVEILRPSPDRVAPPCPHAGPGRCGGCDWQHASARRSAQLKARVVREQFPRLAGMDVTALLRESRSCPAACSAGAPEVYAVGADGQLGLRRHRSHDVEPVDALPARRARRR